MDTSLTVWAITIGAILALIILDFLTVSRKPHDVMFKEALGWSIFYIGVAIAFGAVIWWWAGADFGTQYYTAYLVEKSLSVDNIFVFIIILTQFRTPSVLHQRVLLFGVLLALIFRAIFIAIGAAAISLFAFTFVLFGALLLWTGVQLMRHRNEDPDPMDNIIIRNVRKRVRFSEDYDGTKLFTKIDGAKVATPLLFVMVVGISLLGLVGASVASAVVTRLSGKQEQGQSEVKGDILELKAEITALREALAQAGFHAPSAPTPPNGSDRLNPPPDPPAGRSIDPHGQSHPDPSAS